MSSEQVRNLNTFCSACTAPRRLPALANGPYSFAPLRPRLASDLDTRKVLVRRDLQVGKTLVVAEVAVELGLDVLDQPRFHQEGVDFALGFDEVDVVRLAHELRGSLVVGRRRQEVAAGAGAQVLRLADVDHPAGLVLKQVDARRRGKLAADLLRGAGEKLGLSFRATHEASRQHRRWGSLH